MTGPAGQEPSNTSPGSETGSDSGSGGSRKEKDRVQAKASITTTKRGEIIRTIIEKYNPWTIHKRRRQKPQQIPQKKPPFALSNTGLALLITSEILILISITILWVLTKKDNGFVEVPDTPSTFDESKNVHEVLLWAYTLLWTTVPTLIVTLCGKLFSKTLEALQDCQPTIELRRFAFPGPRTPRKSTARHTILLDYGSEWLPFLDSYRAFCNRHFLISVCMLIKWAFLAIGPLAAAINSIRIVPSSTTIKVMSNTFFDDQRNKISSRPAFDSASAILLNDANPYAWTTKEYSVLPFYAASDAFGNLTASTLTYSATLDCEEIDVDALLGAGNITVQNLGSGNVTHFSFFDRGCVVDWLITTTPQPPFYSKTSFAICPLEADQARVMFMTGEYDSTSQYLLSNFSLLSCVPYFWHSTSQVSVLFGTIPQDTGQIANIAPTNAPIKSYRPHFWQSWLTSLYQYVIQDSTQFNDADDLGRLAYNYALKTKTNGTVDFAQAMNTTFGVLFAAFASTSAYSPRPEPTSFTGTLARPANRLFVVTLPATIVTVVMAISFLTSIWVIVFAQQNRDSIREHMDLILGHAILLEKSSGVRNFADAMRADMQRKALLAAGESNAPATKYFTDKSVLEHGDLVKYAKDEPMSERWSCWVDKDGKLNMEFAGASGNAAG